MHVNGLMFIGVKQNDQPEVFVEFRHPVFLKCNYSTEALIRQRWLFRPQTEQAMYGLAACTSFRLSVITPASVQLPQRTFIVRTRRGINPTGYRTAPGQPGWRGARVSPVDGALLRSPAIDRRTACVFSNSQTCSALRQPARI